jgi:hypothetical protein
MAMIEGVVVILFILSVIMVSLLFAIKRKINSLNIDDPSLQDRLGGIKG